MNDAHFAAKEPTDFLLMSNRKNKSGIRPSVFLSTIMWAAILAGIGGSILDAFGAVIGLGLGAIFGGGSSLVISLIRSAKSPQQKLFSWRSFRKLLAFIVFVCVMIGGVGFYVLFLFAEGTGDFNRGLNLSRVVNRAAYIGPYEPGQRVAISMWAWDLPFCKDAEEFEQFKTQVEGCRVTGTTEQTCKLDTRLQDRKLGCLIASGASVNKYCQLWWLGRSCRGVGIYEWTMSDAALLDRIRDAVRYPCRYLPDPMTANFSQDLLKSDYGKRAYESWWEKFDCRDGTKEFDEATLLKIMGVGRIIWVD